MSYNDEHTPVHQASRDGDTATLSALHARDARQFHDILHAQPRTPLWWACKTGHADVVRLLIDLGSPLDCVSNTLTTATSPLMEAVINSHLAVVRMLVERGGIALAARREGSGDSVLAIAADRGEMEMVRLLVEKGADVNEGNSTPLLYASAKGHIDVMKYLVDHGAMLHAGYVLACAVYSRQLKVVNWLVQSAGVKVDALADGRTALTLAVRDNLEEMARVLLRNGASPHTKLPRGEPMLYHAVYRRYLGIAYALMQYKAQIDEVYNQETVLLLAVTRGNFELVKTLWHGGANLNVKNVSSTPLCVAIRGGHWDIAAYLIDRGVDVSLRENNKADDKFSLSALHLMCMLPEDHSTCSLAVSFLRNEGDVNALYADADNNVVPAIYHAIKKGYSEMVWTLVFAGANLDREIFVDGFPHTVWEVCDGSDMDTKKALFHFWEPGTHFRHPKIVRDAILCVLLIAKRQNWAFDASILHQILSFLAYGWLDPVKL